MPTTEEWQKLRGFSPRGVSLAYLLALRYTARKRNLIRKTVGKERTPTMMLRARIASLLLSLLILLLAGCDIPSAPPATTQPPASTQSEATPTPSPTFTSTLQYLHLPPGFQVEILECRCE